MRRKFRVILPVVYSAILLLFLAACATPPRSNGTATDPAAKPPDAENQPAAADQGQDSRYDFEDEGEIPEPPGDVAFEEDELPPRPEDVEAASLAAGAVAAEEVGDRGDPVDLPDPEADEEFMPIEAEVTIPVAAAVVIPVPAGGSVDVVRGFRVQLFAVGEYARANTMAEEARQRLQVEVHVISEPPHYKVRAGDFVDRTDAVLLKERAMSLGYDGCWVVTDQVEVQK